MAKSINLYDSIPRWTSWNRLIKTIIFIILKSAKTQKISRILAQCLDNDRFSPLRFGTKGEKSRTRVGFIIGSLCGSMKNRKKYALFKEKVKFLHTKSLILGRYLLCQKIQRPNGSLKKQIVNSWKAIVDNSRIFSRFSTWKDKFLW